MRRYRSAHAAQRPVQQEQGIEETRKIGEP
jgi:hypothetical protein